eukprot:215267-Chlamydomonas_euryale.AAC.5
MRGGPPTRLGPRASAAQCLAAPTGCFNLGLPRIATVHGYGSLSSPGRRLLLQLCNWELWNTCRLCKVPAGVSSAQRSSPCLQRQPLAQRGIPRWVAALLVVLV